MQATDDIRKLQARISYLEDNRRYIQSALETVLSLNEFQTATGDQQDDATFLLDQAGKKIVNLIPFSVLAFYLVDEESFLFDLASCAPSKERENVENEVARMIDQGLFAWAIREKRGVSLPAQAYQGECLLHVIAANHRVRGMFFGLLPSRKESIADTSKTLLSIVLMRVANALEELEFRRFLKDQTLILEKQVDERTKALTQSETKLKKAMKKAKQASEAKSDFLAKMSHELRTPLNGIIGMTEVALATQPDAKQAQFLKIIDRESSSLLRLINNILDFSKVEAGKLTLERAPFDLCDIVDEVADAVALKAFQKGLTLTTYVDPRMTTLFMGDAFRVKQILLNLAGNALKFTSSGEICIKCLLMEDSDDQTLVKHMVKDTGIGIPKEKHNVIFQEFSQADDSTTRQYGGTGLGITISSQLLELMGGRLSVISEENQGSTFEFTLRFDKQYPGAGNDPIIIEVDDQEALLVGVASRHLVVLADYLEAMGYTVRTTNSVETALSIFEEASTSRRTPYPIFVDRGIPDIQRSLLSRKLRKAQDGRMVLIVLVAHMAELAQHENTAHEKMDAYLSKPIKLGHLKALLKNGGVENDQAISGFNQCQEDPLSPDEGESLTKGGRILLVDDYPTNQKVAFMHLAAAGYEVDIAENGEKAVAAFKEEPYDLILMDIQMPVMDGFTASKAIREWETLGKAPQSRRIPIIAMTAHVFQKDEQKCHAAGMDDFISKPIRRNGLLQTVSRWMAATDVHPETEQTPSRQTDEASKPDESTPMDFETAVDEFGSREVVMEVTLQLLKNIDNQIDIMREALGSGDFDRLRRESHAIKGGAGTIEAHHLSALAARIEIHSRDEDKAVIEPLLKEFNHELVRLKDYVACQNQQ